MIDYSPCWKTLENSTENWYTLTKNTPGFHYRNPEAFITSDIKL